MDVFKNKEALELALHCIGLDLKKPYKRHGRYFYRPYRNYYDASVKDCETWDLLVQAGYAKAGRKDRYGGRMYWLGRAGLDALGEYLGIKIYDEEACYRELMEREEKKEGREPSGPGEL